MMGQREVAMSDQPSGRFGPQTAHVEAFICAMRDLTDAEVENINRAVCAARCAPRGVRRTVVRRTVVRRTVVRRTGRRTVVRRTVVRRTGRRTGRRVVPRLAKIIDTALADSAEAVAS